MSTARLPREERRRQLLGAAQQVFTEQGYHRASMDEIAEAASVSKPVLYQHFPGKRELFLDLFSTHVDALTERLDHVLRTAENNRERVLATVQVYFAFVDRPDRAHRMVFDSGLSHDPQVTAQLQALTEGLAVPTAQIISEDARLPLSHALILGHSLAGLVQTSARQWADHPGPEPRPTREEAVELTFRLMWRGLRDFRGQEVSPPAEAGSQAADPGL